MDLSRLLFVLALLACTQVRGRRDASSLVRRARQTRVDASVPSHVRSSNAAKSDAGTPPLPPSRCPVGVTSDNVLAGTVDGYTRGRIMRIRVVRVEGKPVEEQTATAFRRLSRAALHAGVHLRIVSGFRTMAHQQALYCAYRHEHGTLAARPGYSNHQSGHALDLNTRDAGVYPWLTRHGRHFGFRRTVRSEQWHWEWWDRAAAH